MATSNHNELVDHIILAFAVNCKLCG